MKCHMRDDDLLQLDSVRPDHAALQRLVRHFLTGCPECRSRYGGDLFCRFERLPDHEVPEPVVPVDYDPALDAALEGALHWFDRQSDRAEVSAGEHAEPPVEFDGAARIDDLLARSFAARYRDPQEMLLLANLAQIAAANLDPSELGPQRTADLRARAWGELANAHRVNDDFRSALEALNRAAAFREAGSGDRSLRARLTELYASYLNSTRYFDEACEILGAVDLLYREAGDIHEAGRALVVRGIYERYRGEPRAACEFLERGLLDLNPDRDPELILTARQSYIVTLVDCGDYRRAHRELFASGLRKAVADQPMFLLKLDWLEAAILAGLGKRQRAETTFLKTRQGFISAGQAFNAGLIGIDLAALYLEDGRDQEAVVLAQEIYKSLSDLGVAREAERALHLLVEACERGVASGLVARHVRHFLERLEREPHLRFRLPA
jgi:tetratricopeptide (TPR) repeat protein